MRKIFFFISLLAIILHFSFINNIYAAPADCTYTSRPTPIPSGASTDSVVFEINHGGDVALGSDKHIRILVEHNNNNTYWALHDTLTEDDSRRPFSYENQIRVRTNRLVFKLNTPKDSVTSPSDPSLNFTIPDGKLKIRVDYSNDSGFVNISDPVCKETHEFTIGDSGGDPGEPGGEYICKPLPNEENFVTYPSIRQYSFTPQETLGLKDITFKTEDLARDHHLFIRELDAENRPLDGNPIWSKCYRQEELKNGISTDNAFNSGRYRLYINQSCGGIFGDSGEVRACTVDYRVGLDPTTNGIIGSNEGEEPVPLGTPCSDPEDPRQEGCLGVDTPFGRIGTTIESFTRFLLGFILSISGGIAVILIIISGYRLMVSRGNPEQVQNAREQLTAAIVGLLFVIFSLVILQVIGNSFLGIF
ncbi:MAG: hypothetical protein COU25_01095 [Candidatus Levybacteria bacterium CG10_big_fil_rev_8_21_14_0_10_35_13]|nr:MAG: hypothetical protein COU25_01095 [Candidatus Levybacteria bacterium CG10_big_fil_rev_8_21_14_0_10_35_13]